MTAPANKKYKDEFITEVVRLGQEGKTKAQMAAHFGVTYSTLLGWSKDISKPEFQEAYKLAVTCSQAYHEDLAMKGAKGLLAKYNAVMHMFLMKNMFPHDYREQVDQKIDINSTVKNMTDEELDKAIEVLAKKKSQKELEKETK